MMQSKIKQLDLGTGTFCFIDKYFSDKLFTLVQFNCNEIEFMFFAVVNVNQ